MTRRLAALVLCLAAAGCVTSRAGIPPSRVGLEAGRTTKAEVYRRLGLPEAVEFRGDAEVLQYGARRSRGTAFGLTGYGVQLMVRNVNQATDRLEVFVGPDGVVRDVRSYPGTQALRGLLWPFGD
ncbi:MAG: hypothetical protein KC466_04980 [Myxococcales bacterium]|nr:hypothetical protein [Myxococcales bacterium]